MQAVYPDNPRSIPTVVTEPRAAEQAGPSNVIIQLASMADTLPPWGTRVVERDTALRTLWKKEPLLKSVIASTAVRYAKLPYVLVGPERMTKIYNRVLHSVDRQSGWVKMMTKACIDMLTQDNGGILEIIRIEDKPTSPMVSMRQLDSSKCRRTGDPETPIRYFDRDGDSHDLKYYQVVDLVEVPMPEENAYGLGMCAVSRVLEAAQLIRDVRIFKSEKIGGRWNRSIHLTTGVPQSYIDDALERQGNNADAAGLLRFLAPLILASPQADKPVSHEEIQLASLPDGFDSQAEFHEYIIVLANGMFLDPLDIAPLESGHLGTGTQADVLAQKGRGKGPDLFMTNVEHMMNYRGLLPVTVSLKYQNQDVASDAEQTMIMWRKAQILSLMLGKPGADGAPGGIINVEVAAQLARDWGLLKPEYLAILGYTDITPTPESM